MSRVMQHIERKKAARLQRRAEALHKQPWRWRVPALTVHQPYAHQIAIAEKRVENRGRWFSVEGWLAIHAGQKCETPALWLERYPRMLQSWIIGGHVVAMAHIAMMVRKATIGQVALRHDMAFLRGQLADGFVQGPWCMVFDRVHALADPVPCRGQQGVWGLPSDTWAAVKAQVPEQVVIDLANTSRMLARQRKILAGQATACPGEAEGEGGSQEAKKGSENAAEC
jgi:hypothetical protein